MRDVKLGVFSLKTVAAKPLSLTMDKQSFIEDALFYSELNVFSISLMSDCGAMMDMTDEKLDKLLRKLKLNDNKLSELLSNLKPIIAVYSKLKAKIIYDDLLPEVNFTNETIYAITQALSIKCETVIAKTLVNESDGEKNINSRNSKLSLALIFIKSAQEKTKFCGNNLRREDGLYNSKGISDLGGDLIYKTVEESKIQLITNSVVMLDSYIELLQTIDNVKYPMLQAVKLSDTLLDYINDIFEVLCENQLELLSADVECISYSVFGLVRYYNMTNNYESEKHCYDLIIKCCAELESRLTPLDRLFETRAHLDVCPLFSNILATKAFVLSFLSTGIDKFRECAIVAFNGLEPLWYEDYAIYTDSRKRTITIGIDEIGATLNMLFWMSSIDKVDGDKCLNRIFTCFEGLFESVGIQLSNYSPAFYDLLWYNGADTKFDGFFPCTATEIKIKPKKCSFEISDSFVDIKKLLHMSSFLLEIVEGLE